MEYVDLFELFIGMEINKLKEEVKNYTRYARSSANGQLIAYQQMLCFLNELKKEKEIGASV